MVGSSVGCFINLSDSIDQILNRSLFTCSQTLSRTCSSTVYCPFRVYEVSDSTDYLQYQYQWPDGHPVVSPVDVDPARARGKPSLSDWSTRENPNPVSELYPGPRCRWKEPPCT